MTLRDDFIHEAVAQWREDGFMHRLRFEHHWDHLALGQLLDLMYALVKENQHSDTVDKAVAKGFYTCIDCVPRFAEYVCTGYVNNPPYHAQAIRLFHLLTDSLFSMEERFITSYEEERQLLSELSRQQPYVAPRSSDDDLEDFELSLDDMALAQAPLAERWAAFVTGDYQQSALGERRQTLSIEQMDAELGADEADWRQIRQWLTEADECWDWVIPGQYAGVAVGRDGRAFQHWVTLTT